MKDTTMNRRLRSLVMPLTSAAFCAAFVGCNSDERGRPAALTEVVKKDPKKMAPSELQQFVSTNAAMAAAETGASLTGNSTTTKIGRIESNESQPLKYQSEVNSVPPAIAVLARSATFNPRPVSNQNPKRTTAPYLKLENITSDLPYETENEARNDALKVASRRIAEKLQTLDPPILATIHPNRVWNDYVSKSSAKAVPISETDAEALKGSPVSGNRIRYQFDVEISEPQLQLLRGEDRVKSIAPFVFGGLAIAGIASLLLRLTGAAAAAVRRS